ncbi:hypothetical protein GBA52_010639 [Prunus armeniaca]|nr:hypothetical protein GBA52_010532 [Prunus armeniaca]KAH0983462.1 hypothetical protein GBA52_010639 [Prunus armeniaca]
MSSGGPSGSNLEGVDVEIIAYLMLYTYCKENLYYHLNPKSQIVNPKPRQVNDDIGEPSKKSGQLVLKPSTTLANA